MITGQLSDRTFEFESVAMVDLDALRLFRYTDLCKCSKFAFGRYLASLGPRDIEKDFIDVFTSRM